MRNTFAIIIIAALFSLTACVGAPQTKTSRSVKSAGDIKASAKVGGEETYSVKKRKAEVRARAKIGEKVRLMSKVQVVDVFCADGSILYPIATECRERFKPAIEEYLVEIVGVARAVSKEGDTKRVKQGAPVSVVLVLLGEDLTDKSAIRYGNYVDKVSELIARSKRAMTYDIKYELLTSARHKLLKAMVFKGTTAEGIDSETKELFYSFSRKIQQIEHEKRR